MRLKVYALDGLSDTFFAIVASDCPFSRSKNGSEGQFQPLSLPDPHFPITIRIGRLIRELVRAAFPSILIEFSAAIPLSEYSRVGEVPCCELSTYL